MGVLGQVEKYITCRRQGEVVTLYATAGVSLEDGNPRNPLGLG